MRAKIKNGFKIRCSEARRESAQGAQQAVEAHPTPRRIQHEHARTR